MLRASGLQGLDLEFWFRVLRLQTLQNTGTLALQLQLQVFGASAPKLLGCGTATLRALLTAVAAPGL